MDLNSQVSRNMTNSLCASWAQEMYIIEYGNNPTMHNTTEYYFMYKSLNFMLKLTNRVLDTKKCPFYI